LALKYPLTKVLGCPKIYFSSAKHLRKLLFHSNQFEKAWNAIGIELNEKINVAIIRKIS